MSLLVRSIFILVMLWLTAPGALASRSVPLFPLSSPDAFGRITGETLPNTVIQASGLAYGAGSVSATLDGSPLSTVSYNPSSGDGRWTAELSLGPGSHTLAMRAAHPLGCFSSTNTSSFSVEAPSGAVTTVFDNAGYAVSRSWSNCTQTLKWDGAGRLVSVTQRDAQSNGYNWSAIYDALGRRLRTVHAVVTAGVAGANTTVDSFYDPQVEFEEIGVALNGARTWKVMGPDLGGAYGSWQGVGGLEATVRESDLQVTPVVADHFGNVVARVSGGQTLWSSNRVDGYGPLLGGGMPVLSASTSLAEASVWRGKRIDPTGFYYLGARHYEPTSGRFLSPDPAGHEGSYDLYSFANGDPVNSFDPDGRYGKAALDRTMQWGVNRWRDDVSTYNRLMSPETRGQTLTDLIYGGNLGAFNWVADSARSAGSLAVGGQFTSYFNNQALDYLSGQGTGFINDVGCVLGADPNSGAARTGEFWSQTILTTGSLFAGQGELKIVRGAERGVLAAESGGVRLSQKGLDLVGNHLSQFEEFGGNSGMMQRLQDAFAAGQKVTGADANFYLHEASEATMMGRGLGYDAAHSAALGKYGVTEFNLYHPEVIQANPTLFNNAWRAAAGLPPKP